MRFILAISTSVTRGGMLFLLSFKVIKFVGSCSSGVSHVNCLSQHFCVLTCVLPEMLCVRARVRMSLGVCSQMYVLHDRKTQTGVCVCVCVQTFVIFPRFLIIEF